MSKLSDDPRGTSTEMRKNDPRKQRGGESSFNKPVEYGQGPGSAGYCYQSDYAGEITNHGTFDPWYREHHAEERQSYFESVSSSQPTGEIDAPAPVMQGETRRVGSADAPYPIHNWPANVPAHVAGRR